MQIPMFTASYDARAEITPEAFPSVMAHLEGIVADGWIAFLNAYVSDFDATEYTRDHVVALFGLPTMTQLAPALRARFDEDEASRVEMLDFFDNLLGYRGLYRCISNIIIQTESGNFWDAYEEVPSSWGADGNGSALYYLRLFCELVELGNHVHEVERVAMWPNSLQFIFNNSNRIVGGMTFLGNALRGQPLGTLGA